MISHVRSLYVPHIADHPHGANLDLRDLALQIVNVVRLRPEVELCYMGLASKCFEILENRSSAYARDGGIDSSDIMSALPVASTVLPIPAGHPPLGPIAPFGSPPVLLDEDDEDDIDIDIDDDDVEDVDSDADADYTDSDDEFMGFMQKQNSEPRLRLREILFYDDKVSVFRARHGRL